jgi:hypothetical protein
MTFENNKIVESKKYDVLISKIGRYGLVKIVLNFILANKKNEDYKNLTQTEIIDKVLKDIYSNPIIIEKIKDFTLYN